MNPQNPNEGAREEGNVASTGLPLDAKTDRKPEGSTSSSPPDLQQSESWQEGLREQADSSSGGSDEASANTLKPDAPGNAGLHGGLVR